MMIKQLPVTLAGEEAVNLYILSVTLPLLADVDSEEPKVLGTGTLIRHEDRLFIVTALHVLKEDQQDLQSPDIDFERVAFPTAPIKGKIHTLGSICVYRPKAAPTLDVVIIEIIDDEVRGVLADGWRAISLDQVAPFPADGPMMANGYLLEGASAKDGNIGQKFFNLGTEPLDHVPEVEDATEFDRFLLLKREGQLADGAFGEMPSLRGMSGTSVWTLRKIEGLWDPTIALKAVGIQTSAKPGHFVRCLEWSAALGIFRSTEVGFSSPP